MDDTHTTEAGHDPSLEPGPEATELTELAAADPADAPDLAEAYAERLGRELDAVAATESPAGTGDLVEDGGTGS